MNTGGRMLSGLSSMIPPVTPREKIERARVQITISSDALLPAMRLLADTRNNDLRDELMEVLRTLGSVEERLYARAKRLQEDGQ